MGETLTNLLMESWWLFPAIVIGGFLLCVAMITLGYYLVVTGYEKDHDDER